ncbi:MAG TPA: hypothetical protein VET48_00920, partial [Steroidobacteraceae bacterium]|nr:hypothetical protein [Steroidobacteraceae bacterium]
MSIADFAEQKLNLHVWSALEELFAAVEAGERRILIRSCNGAGKTTAIAVIVNWMLAYHPESIVLTTASNFIQLRRNLWGEIRRQARNSNLFSASEIREEMIVINDKHFALGISPAVPESAQGYHAPKLVICVDEATAVDRSIMEALLANGTGDDSQVILAYNPLTASSYPYEAERTGEWKIINLSAFDHPNVLSGKEEIKGAVTSTWVRESIKSWSYPVEPESERSFEFENTWYRKTREVAARIFGDWPDDDGEGFFPMYLLKRSTECDASRGEKAMGVDIARGGEDATVFAFFDGNVQQHFFSMRTSDTIEIAEKIIEFRSNGYNIITIDDTGVGGGVTDYLKTKGIDVHAINFGASAHGFFNKEIANARAEMYFVLDD